MTRHDPAAHRGALLATLRVQYPDALADRGFRLLHPTTGDRYTEGRRHLVATCRSVANFSAGALVDGPEWCREAADHGLAFLESAHGAGDATGPEGASGEGYHLIVDAGGDPVDRTRSAYGHAFVLLAYARATEVEIDGAEAGLEATVDLLDERFHDGTGRLRSDCGPDWVEREPYRGQNANMHACEAYLAAYEATDDRAHLRRARRIAEGITVELAAETNGLLWEHYTADWEHDFEYNAAEPRHQFRPPGYQPGHHVEWARFLALLDRYGADADATTATWYERASELFDVAVDRGWTQNGFVYTLDRDGTPLVRDRYGWALAEGIGAAAALHERAATHGDDEAAERFRDWHRKLLVRTDLFRGRAGLWYEKRRPNGEAVAPEPPGVEPDYHPVSAALESYRSLDAASGDE